MNIKWISIVTAIAISLIISCDYNTYQQGKQLYLDNCGHCHMTDGSGVGDLYPSLDNLGINYDYTNISCTIINGKKSPNSVVEMVPITNLTDIEMNNIINYLKCVINEQEGEISIKNTREQILECQK